MKNQFLITALFAIFLISPGCSPVKFYSDHALTVESGLKYFTIKPFLQVERDQLNNKVVKATVIYLPDLSNPQYIVVKDGPGSRKFDLKLVEGTISTLGVSTDPQTAETIESLAALITKSADAVKDLSSLKGIQPASNTVVTELYEFIMDADGTRLSKIEF